MSDPATPGGTPPAPPTGASKDPKPSPPPTPKAKTFKVGTKHDWLTCNAINEGEARQKFQAFFGIKGSDHEVEVAVTGDKPGMHSGQKTAKVDELVKV